MQIVLFEHLNSRIRIELRFGDFAPGPAWISVDAMEFGEPLSLKNADKTRLKLFPNPASEQLTLQSGGEVIGVVFVFDLTGRKVHEAQINADRGTIDIRHLPQGLYTIAGQGGSPFAGKFVVQ